MVTWSRSYGTVPKFRRIVEIVRKQYGVTNVSNKSSSRLVANSESGPYLLAWQASFGDGLLLVFPKVLRRRVCLIPDISVEDGPKSPGHPWRVLTLLRFDVPAYRHSCMPFRKW